MATDKEQRISAFEENLRDYFSVAATQRDEILRSFLYMDCHNIMDAGGTGIDTSIGTLGRQRPTSNKRKANISLLPAIVRGVAGSEAMQERHIDIVPIDDEQYDAEADIMDDAVSYAQYASNWKSAFDARKRDAAICGIGGAIFNLDMTKREAISGVPQCRRIYPGFLYYDTSGRGQDLNATAGWMGYADPMRIKDLQEYAKSKLGDDYIEGGSSSFTDEFMSGLERTEMKVDMLYHYFWRENETVKDTENPINTDDTFKQIMAQDDIALELMGRWAEETKVDIEAPFWTLDKKQYAELKKTLEAIKNLTGEEIEIKSSSREVKCYYRAEYAFGKELSYSKSFSQNEYPLSLVTGYWDESMGIFYGFTRPVSFVQDALNIVMDDTLNYSHDAAYGGPIYVKGAGDDIKILKQAKANQDDVTPIGQNMEITPKELSSTPQILLETAKMLIDLMPRSIGIGPEFLGIVSSGDMTDSLFGRIVRQSFAVLQDFSISSTGASKRDGLIFIDMMISVAKVEDGRILPILSPGHQEKDYKRLYLQNIARAYVIRVIERPVTDDERMENNKILMQLVPALQQSGANIVPAIIENTRMDFDTKQKVLEALNPKPTPPNPMDGEMVKANIRLLNAQAAKLESDAANKAATAPLAAEEVQSGIDKNVASALESLAKAGATEHGMIVSTMESLIQPAGAVA